MSPISKNVQTTVAGCATPYLTELQLAARLQISPKTLRNARVTGGLIPYLKCGRLVRYLIADVEEFERQHMRSSTSEAR